MSEPHRSLEIERSYDVSDETPLPDWDALGLRAGAPEHRELDARYLDTHDAALGRAGVALRRRSGGPDAGWHVKISAPEGKHEWQWPLQPGEDPDDLIVPDEIVSALRRWASPPFTPIARIRNTRIAYALRTPDGALVAEFADDHVRTRAERTGIEQHWREWEIELGPEAPVDHPAFFAAVEAVIFAQGAVPAASSSKLARALGF